MQVLRDTPDTQATPQLPETGAIAGKEYDLKGTAALIKKRLKELYPETKFSVRSESFSQGNAIRVGWVDGPTEKPVQAFLDQFKEGGFNSMTDSYEYHRNHQFTGKYISTSRSYSLAYCPQACGSLDLTSAPAVDVQLRALGEDMLKSRSFEPGRSYGVKAANGHFLFSLAPVHLMDTYTDQRLRRGLEHQGYTVEFGEEAGEYVLAIYRKGA
jgi:hypothetical protein